MKKWTLWIVILALTGCSAAYYGAMEKVGYHKREILVDRIDDALSSQEEAKEQFASALEQFSAAVNFDGGDLEDLYDDLNSEFESAQSDAAAVTERIEEVDDVAQSLFKEWEAELDDYSNANLRRQSASSLRDTQARYRRLIAAMRRAESRLEPVLSRFQDQVLFLKHNLNARAIGSLRGELATIESDVDALIAAMNESIAEAQSFIQSMET